MGKKDDYIATYLPVFPGFYETLFDGEFDEESFSHFPKRFDLWRYVDWTAYRNHISKKCCDAIQKQFSEFIEHIDFEYVYSPKEYNFHTDAIYCRIKPHGKKIHDFIYDNEEAFKGYLLKRLTPYDGFMPFYSNQFSDWEDYTYSFKKLGGKSFYLGFILEFIARQEEYGHSDLYKDISYNGSVTWLEEFMKPDFNKLDEIVRRAKDENLASHFDIDWMLENNEIEELLKMDEYIEEIKSFTRHYYSKLNLDMMLTREFPDTILDIEKIKTGVMNEIASHTLEIKF